jgi:hypothetical protein
MTVLHKLGPLGVIGLGLLFFCAPLYFSAIVPAQRELATLDGHKTPPGMTQRAALDGREDELERFYRLFPPEDQLLDEVQRVYKSARNAGLELLQGEYRAERRPAGLVAYRMTLPVRGGYSQLRAFLSTVLTEIPVASVDAVRFERKKSADAQLEAQIRLTLYLRQTP